MKKTLFYLLATGFVATQSANAQWQLNGNAGTTPASQFLGTTDAKDFRIRTNNVVRIGVTSDGKVGIGTASPSYALDVKADANCTVRLKSQVTGSSNMVIDRAASTENCLVNYKTAGADNWRTGCAGNSDFVIKNPTLGSDALTINSGNNYIGIGTSLPTFRLDITTNNFIEFIQVKTTGGWAGIILDKGADTDNNYMVLRTGGADKWTVGTIANNNFSLYNWTTYQNALTANLSNNFIGIGTASPFYLLDVQGDAAGTSFYNIRSQANYVGSSDIRAFYGYSKPADGYGFGIQATGGWYGGNFTGEGGSYAGGVTGVYGYASGTAGTRYGVYGIATNSGGAAWAGYFEGNTYASTMVVGTGAASSGYSLTVGGKIICTELKVQLMPFPDYVFENSYQLNSIEEVEAHIKQFKRLPGMPSACEIEDNGMAVGEMQGKIVEKVEEQALYIIQLNNKIKALELKLEELARAKDNK